MRNEISKEIKSRWKRYAVYFLCFFTILIVYEFLKNQIIIAFSLGASGFILLISPIRKCFDGENEKKCTHRFKFFRCGEICFYDIRNTLGGYTIGSLFSVLFGLLFILFNHAFPDIINNTNIDFVKVITAATATTFTVFFMSIMKSPHPPAAAFALGLVTAIEEKSLTISSIASIVLSVAVAVFFVVVLCLIRFLFDKSDVKLSKK